MKFFFLNLAKIAFVSEGGQLIFQFIFDETLNKNGTFLYGFTKCCSLIWLHLTWSMTAWILLWLFNIFVMPTHFIVEKCVTDGFIKDAVFTYHIYWKACFGWKIGVLTYCVAGQLIWRERTCIMNPFLVQTCWFLLKLTNF